MAVAIVTGAGGLIGSAAVRRFAHDGLDAIGIENDMRARFFGPDASTAGNVRRLLADCDAFRHVDLDIRDREGIERLFARHGGAIALVVHTAAQPSHDWAASDPHTDFTVNANNIHCDDVVAAFAAFHANPRPAAVYNLGGGRASNCSMLEAIALSEEIAGRELDWTLSEQPRTGDHRWWISDLAAFEVDYPDWSLAYDVPAVLREIHDANVERWEAVPS